jgi:hypothetical protein
MAKKKAKRRHLARASVQVGSLTKAGTSIEIEIFTEEGKLGRLVIGRGSLTWFGHKWKNGKRWSWSRFAEVMDAEN